MCVTTLCCFCAAGTVTENGGGDDEAGDNMCMWKGKMVKNFKKFRKAPVGPLCVVVLYGNNALNLCHFCVVAGSNAA